MSQNTFWKTLLKLLISGGIITVLLVNLESKQLWQTLHSISIQKVFLALLIYLFCQFICAMRWQQVAHSMKLGGGLLMFYQYYLMGMFFGLFLPTAIGGDLGRATLLAKEKAASWLQAFLSVIAERFCGLIGLLLYLILCFGVLHPPEWSIYGYGVLLALTAVAIVFTFGFRWIEHHAWGNRLIQKFILRRKNEEDKPSEAQIWPSHKAVFIGISIALVFHGLSILLQLFLLSLLGANLSFLTMGTIYALSGLASMIPVSLNGIGLREGAITVLLVHWGHLSKEISVTFSLLWLAILLLTTIPGGILLLKQQIFNPALLEKKFEPNR
jgi:glycosyltransferase 2 family protein